MSEEKKIPEGMMEIPHDYLIEGIKNVVANIKKLMDDKRREYGRGYNRKNDYEEFGRRFGYNDPERIWREYDLIWNKQSTQPAIIRGVIRIIGDNARHQAIARLRQETKEAEKKEKTKTDD